MHGPRGVRSRASYIWQDENSLLVDHPYASSKSPIYHSHKFLVGEREQQTEVVAEDRNGGVILPPLLMAGILEDRGRRESGGLFVDTFRGERDEATPSWTCNT